MYPSSSLFIPEDLCFLLPIRLHQSFHPLFNTINRHEIIDIPRCWGCRSSMERIYETFIIACIDMVDISVSRSGQSHDGGYIMKVKTERI